MSSSDPSLSFIRRHHFKDSLALLIVFLSFNHFASLILLVSFSIVTRSRNFLSECFIRFFLPKSHYNGFVNDDDYQIKPIQAVAVAPINNVLSAKTRKKSVMASKQQASASPTNSTVNAVPTNNVLGVNGETTKPRLRKSKKKLLFFLIQEAILAFILKYYGDKYFTEPIENLAMSIVASSLVNDPKDALSVATTSSIIYALSTQWIQKLLFLFDYEKAVFAFPSKPTISRWTLLIDKYPSLTGRLPSIFEFLTFSSRYIRYASYLASFHVVVAQIEQNLIVQSYERKNNESNSNDQINQGPSNASPTTPLSSSTQTKEAPIPQSSNMAHSSSASSSFSLPGTNLNNTSNPQEPAPIYSSLVKDSVVNDISITSPSASNNQTWVPNITTAFSTESNLDHQNDLSNQVYKLELNLESQENCPNLSTISTVNLQNFVRQLFRWKNHHIIPPIWAIFTATQTLISEKHNIQASNDNVTPLTTTVAVDDDKITPTESDSVAQSVKSNLSPVNSNPSKGVFTSKAISDSMTLIAPAMDDYHKLNLVSTETRHDYKVCITFIGANSITFKIDSLFEGELIILVNGVIWSQVGSAIVPSIPGQEYTIVSGLVPLCSYDIQFVNRLNELEDYLIADLMVRTIGKNGDQEALDLSFPSYYHRKFLSPILTLKHSILTTNANLADERAKVKKTRKEVTKKVNTMKQDIETFKTKLEFNVTQDEKSASKVENLKMALKQGEFQTTQLEEKLKELTQKETELEEVYLVEKDNHFQRTLECSKTEDQWKLKLKEAESQLSKLKQELQQLQVKKSKSVNKHAKLQKEVNQINDDFDKYTSTFLEKRNRERVERNQLRSQEATEYELRIKGLEQDISRLEGEASQLHQILQNTAPY
ncbi:Nnf2p [Kluyveromyces lactis]|uniref:KLLA0D14707p n=1 Tax=Kluyveromyces lactis (strain ATCC 8585 / CBS 2359 / DSM 70799 / NBRC 1267 / NRRL Y-1140 / WM37) TaxID=284590 RepID=Q6CQS7_KLULA|nr:uncharacterized protein KLLA0_D14707g [Kluyveromyces lactis]CAH00808.1 KLLA0D14707p [Kluyveromyces lactis]|eukprot:XP_453712.1 uncharacterized protein KLLA0_D14707g [Kluyveromyces lactis]